ncbi:hypothetical protein SASPL_148254 [Salvia splendens]|uniref:Uncharacterized protein n=1 Tax=Salvia splendens TaxID=180675 RepID=A0A8X8W9M5_SALSN|nr:UPF0496 protein At3g49070-like [Salvia splendens]KAG6390516.1 hypothetical protein SASPL_148254 [Salvia splendens]
MIKINVNDEYLCAVRTKSFADFFVHAQLLLVPSSPSDLLLNPSQETIASLLKSSGNSRELNSILLDYFSISAEASHLCTNILKTLIHLQTIYRSISNDQIIDPNTISYLLESPLPSGLDRRGFGEIQERQARVLQRLRSSRKKMAGKLRVLEFVWGCDRVMRGVVEQLDVAAKGVYILKRDFDTIGRAVERMGGEIEHDRAMMERGRSVEVLKESEFGVSRQAEELEEHVYLCLLTINRARAMVVREICRSSMT